ncbi:hypothetical protein BZG36_03097 [Bifiguratus adelaidae]|uniref:Major facilitator superfamily (MFS) profile domain-containing protein n=1 Tax=Bifiguratus adelaidae TaxID=1938954 RepID=A0A261XYX2_9FUNG|nr:hypothetical protein BZG36_03097 [Bifiguratus adelaidae]
MDAEKAQVTTEEGAPRAKMSDESFDNALTHQTSVTDTEKGSSAYASSIGGGVHLQEYRKAERKLVRKLDMVILPLTMCMYLSAYLDRGNMGNARLQGLQTEVLDNDDIKYDVCLASFYIAYIIFNIPGNMMAKFLPPAAALSIACLIWGIAATCQASVTSYAGLVVCRLFIGIGEAGFGPTVPLTTRDYWYKRNEIATRISLFIGCGALAGTFGGLIAYGVDIIKGASLSDWRILFLIEGLPTVLLALVVFFCLPDRPETSKFITEEERTIANTRLNSQGLAEGPRNFHWPSLRHALTDYKNWMMACMYLGINLTLGSISGFLPTIIKTMGYSSVNAQLYTVPPYAVALVYMTIVSNISDRLKIRGLFVFMNGMVAAIGFIILITVQQNQGVR